MNAWFPAFVASASLVLAAGMSAQTSAPLPAATAPEHPDYSGIWTLDRGLSTDLTRISLQPVAGADSRPRVGIGRGGLGIRSGGGERWTNEALTPDEQAGLKALSDQLRTSFATLIITHDDPSFIVNDSQSNALFFETNHATDTNHLAVSDLVSSTDWDGSRIATEFNLGSHVKVDYTYTLLPSTNQLVLRVVRKDDSGRSVIPEIKLVYTRPPSSPK